MLDELKQDPQLGDSVPKSRDYMMKYFESFPFWALVCIGLGLALTIFYGLGLILIGLAVWGIMNWRKRPTDQEVDTWIEEELKKLHKKALAKTGTDVSELVGENVLIVGFPRSWQLNGATYASGIGKDNILRFTPLSVTIINFTAHQLISYYCDLDLSTGKAINENTDEYFYKDIVSVSTQTKTQTVQLPNKTQVQTNTSETFILTTSGGTSIEVRLRDNETIAALGGGEIPITRTEKAIQTVRKMLREKKGDTPLATAS